MAGGFSSQGHKNRQKPAIPSPYVALCGETAQVTRRFITRAAADERVKPPRRRSQRGGSLIRIARRRAEEERGDTLFVPVRRRRRRRQSAIRARDVRAADLQEKPTKLVTSRAKSSTQAFRRIRRRRRLPGEHRCERSEPMSTASPGERSNQARTLSHL